MSTLATLGNAEIRTLSVFFVLSSFVLANPVAAQTFNTNGSWNTATNWSTGSVPSGTGTDVTLGANPSLNSGANNTIGNVSVNNGVTVTVNANAKLTLGSSALFSGGTKKSITFSNNGTIQVNSGSPDGVFEIWGDLVVGNNLQMQVTGNLIVHGNIVMNNNAQIQVSGGGTITVGGNVSGGNNAQIQVSGSGSTISVTGSLSLGNGGQIQTSGGGTITSASCTCSGCSSQCNSVVLPIELISFEAFPVTDRVVLQWSTATELNFDYFSVQKSSTGTDFSEIEQVKGHGTANKQHNYRYEDNQPTIGRSYYRLVSNDFDGYQQVFNVVSIDYKGEKAFSVSPNPTDGTSLNLNFNFASESEGHVVIYDNVGSIIGTYPVTSNGSIIFAHALTTGVYMAKYTSGSFTKTERFLVKQ